MGVVFVAPLFFGGRHELGRFVFVVLCVVAAIAWSIRQAMLGEGKWHCTAAFATVSLAIGLVGLQLTPLPSEWLTTLAPRNVELLRAADESLAADSKWSTISLNPDATRMGLATLVAYGLLFLTVTQRLQSFRDIERLLRWVGLSALAMACFGLIQYFASNGRFFWFYEYPYSDTLETAKGSFSCRNHFAHFLVLGLAPLVAWIVQRTFSQKSSAETNHEASFRGTRPGVAVSLLSVVLSLGAAIIVLAVMLSFSRGGALTLACMAAVMAAVYLSYGLISITSFFGCVTAVVVIVLATLSIYGYDQVAGRLDDFTSGSVEELDVQGGRRKIWAANLEAFRAGWRSGSGVGTHRYIYPAYLPESLPTEFTHAENGPLQVMTENGMPGVVLLIWGIACCGVWCASALKHAKRPREKLLSGAVTAGLAASVVHSLVDFVWFVPACVGITILLACCALRLAQLASPTRQSEAYVVQRSRSLLTGAAAMIVVIGLWAISTLAGPAAASLHWDRYLLADIASKSIIARQFTQLEEATSEGHQAAQIITESMIEELAQVVRLHPTNGRAHLRLAGNYLRQFELRQSQASNQMSIAQIRDAAIASQFSSSANLREWLLRAFGKESDLLYLALQHTRQALRNCPLQGEAYLYLANLCFLEGRSAAEVDAYVAQALRVNPYSAEVLFAAGLHEFLSGRLDQAIERWKGTFRFSGSHQYQIVNLFAGKVPAAVFLEEFQPDWRTLRQVWARYRAIGDRKELEAIARYARLVTEKQLENVPATQVSRNWRWLAAIQQELGQHEAALVSLQSGLEANRSDFQLRMLLGIALLEQGDSRQAEEQFRWCVGRRPNHAVAQKRLVQAAQLRVGRSVTSDRTSPSL